MKNYLRILLIFIVIVGSILRFTSVNWDSFQAFHPDERNISWAVTRIHFFDELNPKFFAYGGLPIYLYRALGEGVVTATKDPSWLSDWGKIAVIGRYVSATLSSISIILIFLVGSHFFSPIVGLLSAFILTFSPWAIREAHFSTTETMLVFFLLSLLLLARKYIDKPSKKLLIAQGIVLGFATAAKTTSLLFALIPLTSILLRLTKIPRPRITHELLKTLVDITVFLIITAYVALLFSPYTIFDWNHFVESMRYESGVALGNLPVPYTLQFRGTLPYLYQLETMMWQAGLVPVIGLVGFVGIAFSFLKKKRRELSIFLIFPVVYGAFAGAWFAKFGRYNVPFLPFATIAAAWILVFLFQKFSKKKFYLYICLFVYLFICVSHALWGLANWTIYLRPQTRIEASRWMYSHIPKDSIIYTEHWNDGLPVTASGIPNINFRRDLLTVYDSDNEEKLKYYGEKLSSGDFIILSTRRIWATMPKLKDKYPITSRFYEKLLNGTLGYKEVATFTSYPHLFGIEINDDTSEESVQVFDHPTVRIFQNKGKFSSEEIQKDLKPSVGS